MEKRFNYVYLTTNLVNGKQYVGDRSCDCLIEKDKYLGSGIYYKKAERKYGKNKFKKEILECFDTKKEAFESQEKYINKYKTLTPNGYNISPKGGHDVKGGVSEETKLKIGIKSASRKYNEEQRKHMSDSHKGKKLSAEHIKNRTIAQTGLKRSEATKKLQSDAHKNKQKSTEHKKHLSESLKGKKLSQKQIDARKNMKRINCEYCGKNVNLQMHSRFHGEKCKNKNN